MLQFFRYRFRFRAIDALYFPPGKAGNILRGAFGTIFRKIACAPSCGSVPSCEIRHQCSYAKVFEPQALPSSPSGYSDIPRPFVLRAAHLGSRRLDPGEEFTFGLHLFNTRDSLLPYFVLTFIRIVEEGIGPGRGRAQLLSVEQLSSDDTFPHLLFENGTFLVHQPGPPLILDLTPHTANVRKLHVRFLTPTELKSNRESVSRPEFPVLFARLRDRISNLRAFYGDGPLPIDFRGIAERAANIRLIRCDIRHEHVLRRSCRSAEVHPIGGFVGDAGYEGDLDEFLPYLLVGRYTGVGKHTVWGNGELEVRASA
ncbi:MAG: CRISPR system precrRNA processing endoribonuclease RAMP protein Cas6 [Bryobacterales bacterium]|nr:CRISPR system precrRNA processing endoribonuclease RAMP protein Cas6 [Bryobacterales bacterium]